MNIKLSVNRALSEFGKNRAWYAEQQNISAAELSRRINSGNLTTKTLESMAAPFGVTVSEFLAIGERDPVVKIR